MKVGRHFLLLVVAASGVLGGCEARLSAQPVVATDSPGLYVLTTSSPAGHSGILIAQSQALEQARSFCGGRDREMRTVRDNPVYEAGTGQARFTVAFRCEARGDHAL